PWVPPSKTLQKMQSTWNPPLNLVQPLDEVWQHQVQTYPADFQNYGYDRVFANQGKLNYCARLETDRTVDAGTRVNIETALNCTLGT
ncbi:hypothetical protein L218DRAFT_859176, partial [Marasmius fiardii PR-910]